MHHTVFTDLNAIFFHIPRCGGGTVLRTLESRLGLPNSFHSRTKKASRRRVVALLTPRLGDLRARRFARGHEPVPIKAALIPPQMLADYFGFTFVRNPYDRLYSAWYGISRRHRGLLERWRRRELRDFNAFVAGPLRERIFDRGRFDESCLDEDSINIHFHPQFGFVHDGRRLVVDEIGRLERFEDDFRRICERLGLAHDGPLVTRHINYRGDLAASPRYLDRFDRRSIEIADELYADDFGLFGYRRLGRAGAPKENAPSALGGRGESVARDGRVASGQKTSRQ